MFFIFLRIKIKMGIISNAKYFKYFGGLVITLRFKGDVLFHFILFLFDFSSRIHSKMRLYTSYSAF